MKTMMQVIYHLLKPNCFDKNKRARAKNILIMVKQAINFDKAISSYTLYTVLANRFNVC